MSEYSLEDKYNLIKKAVVKCDCEKNPVAIALKIMQNDFVNIHGPEHHFLDGAAFLTAFKNAGGSIDLERCLDELAKRAMQMPGAMCGYWGVCCSVASIGAALSIIHGTSPLSDDEYYKHNMEYTAAVLADMSKLGSARCCMRNAFLSLTHAVKFVKEKYNIQMEIDNIICEFSQKNKQCLGNKCPFHFAN